MNSENILNYTAEQLEQEGHKVKKIFLSRISVSGCIACEGCANEEKCVNDETANQINKVLKKADVILAVTPVYFGSMTSQLKALFDKTLPLRRNGFLLKNKFGAAISVGKSRNGGQELALKDIHSWMFIHGMRVVGDNGHFGGTVVADFENDETGRQTVDGVINAIKDLSQ